MGRTSDNSLRDVVALSTLPAIWTGANPKQIAESLAASVFRMLDPEFVYVSFVLGASSPPVAVAQTGRYEIDQALAEQIGPAVADWARAHDPDDLLALKLPGRCEAVRLVTRPIGLDAELGSIAAAFGGEYHPSSTDLLLLNVAATQAAVAVQNAKLLEALRASDRRERARAAELQAILDAVPVAMFVSQDPECRNMLGSRLTYEMLRLPPGANVSMSATEARPFRAMRDGLEIPPEGLPTQQAAATGQPVRNYEFDLLYEDGTRRSMLGDAVPLFGEDGRPRGVVGAFVDITERKRNEERLRQSQKLESIGLLAGGIAHDFNNLLVGVIGNASLVQEMLPPNHPASELVDGIFKTGEQLAHLTRQMLAYSGKGRFYVEILDISALAHQIGHLVRSSIPKKVVLHFDLDENLPGIEADRGQVQQILLNLMINAAEAIGSSEGLVKVSTARQLVDAGFIRAHSGAFDLQPGEYVVLEVRDTGCGMDEAVKAKIFDPFFSTKFTGRGLGLAAVSGIVRGHKGAILVNSEPGKGSTFTVLFPATGSKAERSQRAIPRVATGGSGVVLVIDDEQIVREMAKQALERNGYRVLVAYGGLAAVNILRRHAGKIDVAVLDLSMPGMSGEETLPELRKLRPDVKVLVSSGYSEAEAMAMFRGQKVSGFIQKPYSAAVLAEKVKAVMGDAALRQAPG
jgi:two-component system, cell cycle sensor histidine kinase and response regulator CckA